MEPSGTRRFLYVDVSVPSGTRYQYGGSHGYYTDTGTGLMKLGARYYDPTIGRFITKDPARDGSNWYAYCGGNPVNAVDPSGLSGSYDPYGYSYGLTTNWAKERHLDFLTPATRALDNSASAAFGWASETWSNTMGNQAWIEDNLGPALFSGGASVVIGEGSLSWLGAKMGLSGLFGGASESAAGIAANRLAGLTFEDSALAARGLAKNGMPLVGETNGGYVATILDSLSQGALWEIKSGSYVSFSSQIQAGVGIAMDAGLPYNMIVRPGASVWKPVLNALQQTGGRVQTFDPITGLFGLY